MDRKRTRLWPAWCAVFLALIVVADGKVHGKPFRQGDRRLESVASQTQDIERFEHVGAAARLADVLDVIQSSNVPQLVGPAQWRSLVGAYRDTIEQAGTHREFSEVVNELIRAGGVSHFGYYTDQDWLYWFLRSTFYYDSPEAEVEHIGIFPQLIDGRWFVRGIFEGSPADATIMRVGDEIVSVDGFPYSPVASFAGKAGCPTHIRLCRKPGLFLNVIVTPVHGSTFKASQAAMKESIHVIEHRGYDMAYMHGWTLLGGGSEYDRLDELEEYVDGLLLDYRDGFGGTWGAAGLFLLGRRHDDGTRGTPQWTKPVVILTDDGTRSAKEIVVDAVKEAGRAPLVGAPTPGSVTSVGGIHLVGSDGLLMVPGHSFSLEGKPTEPDFLVRRDIRYCAGGDVQLTMAKKVLAGLIRQAQEEEAAAKTWRRAG